MDVSYLAGKVPKEIVESISARGIRTFTPPQEESINKGLLSYGNILVASPTASGKTLIAEMACVNSILSRRRKAIYIAPMRALVSEKFERFKADYPYIRAAMSIGDLDSTDNWLESYEMMFFSTEKLDSLIRHGVNWLDSVGCIVFDEIHMLADASRGPTLELLIAKLMERCDAQVIALSATVGNADELAEWLKARLVVSDYRPVELKKGVVYSSRVYFDGTDTIMKGDDISAAGTPLNGTNKDPEIRVVEDTLSLGKQALIFFSSKRNAEAAALRISKRVSQLLSRGDTEALSGLGDLVMNVLDNPTEQCRKLSAVVREGVAFHHAGLLNSQRAYVEDAFRGNLIKVVCSTTTLGMGINMPAHTVLVRDVSRFDDGAAGMIGVNEMLQLLGRAGRPEYDTEGRALLMAKTPERIGELYSIYINAGPVPVDSKLGIVSVLRTHILAFIAERFADTRKAMLLFLEKSFYGHQNTDRRHMEEVVDEILDELIEWKFIEQTGPDSYAATRIGSRVSELYIDPLSAAWLVSAITRANDTTSILYTITNTMEMRPHVKVTTQVEDEFAAYQYMNKGMPSEYEMYDARYETDKAFSTALMLRDWMDETHENDLVKKYSTTPGALYAKLRNADWVLYSTIELGRLMKRPLHDFIDVRVRLRYGIKEELLDLVRLEQIGRARARLLYANGIRKVSDIRTNRDRVTSLLGKEISRKIFEQID